MTAPELRETLSRLGLSQTEASRVLGVTDRAVRRWISGEAAVPRPVEKIVRLMLAGRITADEVKGA